MNVYSKRTIDRVVSNFGWSVINDLGSKGLLFLAMIYLARVLGTESFGLFNIANTLVLYFWMAVDLGSNMYGAREVSKHRENPSEILNTLLSIRITSGIIVFFLFIIATYITNVSLVFKQVCLGFSFYLISRSIYTEWFLRGIEKVGYIAFGNLLTFGINIVLCILFVTNEVDLVRAAYIWSLSFFVGGIVLLLLIKNTIHNVKIAFTFNLKEWRYHLRESIHFSLSGGLSTLYQQMPIFLLGVFSSLKDVGLYSAAHRIIFSIIFVFTIFPLAIYPILSDLHRNDRLKYVELFKKSALIITILALLLCMILFYISTPLFTMIYGIEYLAALVAFKIMIGFLCLRTIREVVVIAISSAGHQRLITVASLFGLGFVIVSYIFVRYFVHLLPITAAATSLVVTEIGILSIVIAIARKKGLGSNA